MEEMNEDPFQINSNVDVRKICHPSSIYLNKKRKFQDENSDLPLQKHTCRDKSSISQSDYIPDTQLDPVDFTKCIRDGSNDNCQARNAQTDDQSAKDSNSFSEDMDSVMSVSDDSKTELQYLKICPYDWPSTSSVNWGGNFSNGSINSSDSRSERKTTVGNSRNSDFPLYTCKGFEEYYEDCAKNIEFDSSECKSHSAEELEDKELEDLLFSKGVKPNNFVLSSGRWDVNQDAQQDTEKLTIDKEFEQYFSMLML